jgi:hypothetical protein
VIQCLIPSAVTSLGPPAKFLKTPSLGLGYRALPAPGPASEENDGAAGAIPPHFFVSSLCPERPSSRLKAARNRGRLRAAAGLDDSFAAIASRAAVVTVMAELVVPIAGLSRGRKPRSIANDSDWIPGHDALRLLALARWLLVSLISRCLHDTRFKTPRTIAFPECFVGGVGAKADETNGQRSYIEKRHDSVIWTQGANSASSTGRLRGELGRPTR